MINFSFIEDYFIADLFREYIESYDVKVTAVYTPGKEALPIIPSIPLPDVLFVIIRLPYSSGIGVISRLKEFVLKIRRQR